MNSSDKMSIFLVPIFLTVMIIRLFSFLGYSFDNSLFIYIPIILGVFFAKKNNISKNNIIMISLLFFVFIFSFPSIPRYFFTFVGFILYSIAIDNLKISRILFISTGIFYFVFVIVMIFSTHFGIIDQTFQERNNEIRTAFGFGSPNTIAIVFSNAFLIFFAYKFDRVNIFLIPILIFLLYKTSNRSCLAGFVLVLFFMCFSKMKFISSKKFEFITLNVAIFLIILGNILFFSSRYILNYLPWVDELFSYRIYYFSNLFEVMSIKNYIIGGINTESTLVDSVYVTLIANFGIFFSLVFYFFILKSIKFHMREKNYRNISIIIWILTAGIFENILTAQFIIPIMFLTIINSGCKNKYSTVINFRKNYEENYL